MSRRRRVAGGGVASVALFILPLLAAGPLAGQSRTGADTVEVRLLERLRATEHVLDSLERHYRAEHAAEAVRLDAPPLPPSEGLPRRLAEWLGSGTTIHPVDWSHVYRDLATSPAPPARSCLEGDAASCRVVAGLTPPASAALPLTTLQTMALLAYGGAGVMHRAGHLLDPGRSPAPALTRCLGGNAAECEDFLDGRGPFLLTPQGRSSLLRTAIAAHAEGYARLLEANDDTDPAAALEHAAGMPLDRILEAWSRRVREAKPRRRTAASLAAGLFWILLFMGLATRSTRWRVG